MATRPTYPHNNAQWRVTRKFETEMGKAHPSIHLKDVSAYMDYTLSELGNALRAPIETRRVEIDKNMQFGVFARKTIRKHTYLDVYLGRDMKRNSIKDYDLDNDMSVCYGDRVVVGDRHSDRRWCAHLINDSSEGGYLIKKGVNVQWNEVSVTSARSVIVLSSSRVIKRNEELLLDYGEAYWRQRNANGHAVFIPHRILREETQGLRRGLLVRWKHYNDLTWEKRGALKNLEILKKWDRRNC